MTVNGQPAANGSYTLSGATLTFVNGVAGGAVVRVSRTVSLDFTNTGTGTNSENVVAVQGNINLALSGFVSLSGDFSFQKTDATVGSLTNTTIAVGGTNISAFLGVVDEGLNDETGVKLTGANLALLIFKSVDTNLTAQHPATYALATSMSVGVLWHWRMFPA